MNHKKMSKRKNMITQRKKTLGNPKSHFRNRKFNSKKKTRFSHKKIQKGGFSFSSKQYKILFKKLRHTEFSDKFDRGDKTPLQYFFSMKEIKDDSNDFFTVSDLGDSIVVLTLKDNALPSSNFDSEDNLIDYIRNKNQQFIENLFNMVKTSDGKSVIIELKSNHYFCFNQFAYFLKCGNVSSSNKKIIKKKQREIIVTDSLMSCSLSNRKLGKYIYLCEDRNKDLKMILLPNYLTIGDKKKNSNDCSVEELDNNKISLTISEKDDIFKKADTIGLQKQEVSMGVYTLCDERKYLNVKISGVSITLTWKENNFIDPGLKIGLSVSVKDELYNSYSGDYELGYDQQICNFQFSDRNNELQPVFPSDFQKLISDTLVIQAKIGIPWFRKSFQPFNVYLELTEGEATEGEATEGEKDKKFHESIINKIAEKKKQVYDSYIPERIRNLLESGKDNSWKSLIIRQIGKTVSFTKISAIINRMKEFSFFTFYLCGIELSNTMESSQRECLRRNFLKKKKELTEMLTKINEDLNGNEYHYIPVENIRTFFFFGTDHESKKNSYYVLKDLIPGNHDKALYFTYGKSNDCPIQTQSSKLYEDKDVQKDVRRLIGDLIISKSYFSFDTYTDDEHNDKTIFDKKPIPFIQFPDCETFIPDKSQKIAKFTFSIPDHSNLLNAREIRNAENAIQKEGYKELEKFLVNNNLDENPGMVFKLGDILKRLFTPIFNYIAKKWVSTNNKIEDYELNKSIINITAPFDIHYQCNRSDSRDSLNDIKIKKDDIESNLSELITNLSSLDMTTKLIVCDQEKGIYWILGAIFKEESTKYEVYYAQLLSSDGTNLEVANIDSTQLKPKYVTQRFFTSKLLAPTVSDFVDKLGLNPVPLVRMSNAGVLSHEISNTQSFFGLIRQGSADLELFKFLKSEDEERILINLVKKVTDKELQKKLIDLNKGLFIGLEPTSTQNKKEIETILRYKKQGDIHNMVYTFVLEGKNLICYQLSNDGFIEKPFGSMETQGGSNGKKRKMVGGDNKHVTSHLGSMIAMMARIYDPEESNYQPKLDAQETAYRFGEVVVDIDKLKSKIKYSNQLNMITQKLSQQIETVDKLFKSRESSNIEIAQMVLEKMTSNLERGNMESKWDTIIINTEDDEELESYLECPERIEADDGNPYFFEGKLSNDNDSIIFGPTDESKIGDFENLVGQKFRVGDHEITCTGLTKDRKILFSKDGEIDLSDDRIKGIFFKLPDIKEIRNNSFNLPLPLLIHAHQKYHQQKIDQLMKNQRELNKTPELDDITGQFEKDMLRYFNSNGEKITLTKSRIVINDTEKLAETKKSLYDSKVKMFLFTLFQDAQSLGVNQVFSDKFLRMYNDYQNKGEFFENQFKIVEENPYTMSNIFNSVYLGMAPSNGTVRNSDKIRIELNFFRCIKDANSADELNKCKKAKENELSKNYWAVQELIRRRIADKGESTFDQEGFADVGIEGDGGDEVTAVVEGTPLGAADKGNGGTTVTETAGAADGAAQAQPPEGDEENFSDAQDEQEEKEKEIKITDMLKEIFKDPETTNPVLNGDKKAKALFNKKINVKQNEIPKVTNEENLFNFLNYVFNDTTMRVFIHNGESYEYMKPREDILAMGQKARYGVTMGQDWMIIRTNKVDSDKNATYILESKEGKIYKEEGDGKKYVKLLIISSFLLNHILYQTLNETLNIGKAEEQKSKLLKLLPTYDFPIVIENYNLFNLEELEDNPVTRLYEQLNINKDGIKDKIEAYKKDYMNKGKGGSFKRIRRRLKDTQKRKQSKSKHRRTLKIKTI